MDVKLYFLLHLMLYRLAIIASGVICITLGYRMFCKGLWPDSKTGESEMKAEIGGVKFFLKNGAPGTLFAVFGAAIIIAMIISGSPEYGKETLNQTTTAKLEEKETLKGNSEEGQQYAYYLQKAKSCEKNGQLTEAVDNYAESLRIASESMNNLAWLYLETGENLDEASSISKMAVKFNPKEGNCWDTLAEILYKQGKYQDALEAKEKAAALDVKYKKDIEKFKEAVK